ncbi:UNVERIFIED_CONTAM: hypothetical protein FKN15_013355 [Acipenser sinensis]
MHKYAREAYSLGIRYIGGCCGFEPYHIRAVAEELAPERGFLPPASEKHGSWGSGLEMHTKPWCSEHMEEAEWAVQVLKGSGKPVAGTLCIGPTGDLNGVSPGDCAVKLVKAVRPNVFEEKEKQKFVFIVAWNEVEGKFAITCHNRTVQRQRSAGRDAAAATGVRVEDPASSTAAVIRTGEDKHKTVRSTLQEKVRGRKAGAGDGIGRGEDGHREVKGESRSKIPVQGKAAVAASQIKTTQACSKVRGKSPARLLDIEILDPSVIKAGSGTAEGETAESEELESGVREHCSWAGLFSFLDLRAIHQQLCSVNSDLEPCLPLFPEEPSGVWTVLFAPPEATPKETETLCYQLQVYLGHALDTCGWKILSEILFAESDDPEEYYESLSELRQKGYEEVLQRAKKRLHELLEKHKTTESMVDLLDIYTSEDEAYNSLVEATTELYQYLLQPFRDMRELAMLRRQQIKMKRSHTYAFAEMFQFCGCRTQKHNDSEDPLSESEAQPGSPVRQPGELVTETLQASSTLPSAQLFDSSQLVSARKKLKKTSAMEGSQKRRTSSPMDEVLASLKRGSFHLRKMEQRAMPPSPEEDDSNNILAQIRKGVPLKKVQHEELQDSLGELPDSADPLTRSIHEALRRIKDASPESDSEDEGLPCADWDS